MFGDDFQSARFGALEFNNGRCFQIRDAKNNNMVQLYNLVYDGVYDDKKVSWGGIMSATGMLEDIRSYFFMQRAVLRGRRNAAQEESLQKETTGLKKSNKRHLMQKFLKLIRSDGQRRRDSWNDQELFKIVQAQFSESAMKEFEVADF
eukprot:gene5745-6447_t